jgi:hypothetical protein
MPTGQVVKGVSALVDPDGRVKQQWIKTREDRLDPLQVVEWIKQAFDGFDPAGSPTAAAPAAPSADLLTSPIGTSACSRGVARLPRIGI